MNMGFGINRTGFKVKTFILITSFRSLYKTKKEKYSRIYLIGGLK
ncbi:hypothetical protein TPE_2736 [Treponema pedis str. T A4]|uniref:Uncharacterized protein n=1 Tax=Treponema pedis str. T A4 TaxID=1291379 RepID=S6A2A3_9SPIR|nr:hypothetical protein TPE_2736 [Treponema pedis str. T A4]